MLLIKKMCKMCCVFYTYFGGQFTYNRSNLTNLTPDKATKIFILLFFLGNFLQLHGSVDRNTQQ